jgi:hypothetical protein
MKKEVTEEKFNEIRNTLAQAETATKVVPMSAISVDERSLRRGEILVGGISVPASAHFFVRLAALLKMSNSLTKDLLKNNDDKIAMVLINGLNQYRSSRGGGEVLLIANPHTKEVIDICEPKNYRRLTNETLFDVTARILNDNPGLSIETIDMNPKRGGVAINLLNSEEVGFPGAGKDEFFKFGFSIVQRSKDTIIESYNQRLVCSNGLRVSLGEGAIGGNKDINFEDKFRLEGTSADQVRDFLTKLENMKKAGFIPSTFQATLDRAVTTKASFLEVENAMLSAQQLVREEMPDIKKSYIDSIARNYFHAHGDASARVFKGGFNPLTMNDKQKSFIKSGMSVWDVVNSLTFLGSNNSGIPMSDQHQLKAEAGSLFGKGTKDGYDLQFAQFASL